MTNVKIDPILIDIILKIPPTRRCGGSLMLWLKEMWLREMLIP
jgi:hypothetical protein